MDIAFLKTVQKEKQEQKQNKNTNRHVIYRFLFLNGYNLRTHLASLLLFHLLKKICANAPKKKDQHPLCSTHLFGVSWRGGADDAKRLCQAKSHGASSLDAAGSHAVLTGRKNKKTKLGPGKKTTTKKERMDGLYFLECDMRAFSMQRTM